MTLVEVIDAAEAYLDRGLEAGEIAMAGRMHAAGSGITEILALLDKEVEQPPDNDGETTHRYEAVGNRIREVK